MVKSKDFEIQFSALKLGSHLFHFDIEDSFFTLFEYSEIENANLSIDITLVKKATLLQLNFAITGHVSLPCDRCNDIYLQTVKQDFDLIVKFSDAIENVESDEIIILSTNEHSLSLARYIYEFVHLCLPAKRTHQNEEECRPEMIEYIKSLGLAVEETEEEEYIDPRWESLKQIKTK